MQRFARAVVMLLLLGLGACTGSGSSNLPASSNVPSQAGAQTASLPSRSAQAGSLHLASSSQLGTGMAINAAGAGAGNFASDMDYYGGWVSTVVKTIDTSSVTNPPPQAVYQSLRTGVAFSYVIPGLAPNAAYTVRLHFVESWFSSARQRVFNVTINGSQVLSNYDIFQAAGGANKATVEEISTSADGSGKITIAFAASLNNASVAGLEILGGSGSSTPAPTPIPAPQSGGSWPAAGWMPYGSGPLTVQVGSNPSYTSDSSTIINTIWNGRPYDAGLIQAYAGSPPPSNNDWTADVLYFGHSGDPAYTISCYDYGGACGASGMVVHIPRGAYPAGAADHHIDIRDTTTGKDVLLWAAPVPSGNGGTYSVGWGAAINSNSDGLNAVGSTASGISALWSVRETDLVHNTINHALVVSVNGESSQGYVYPATGWDNKFFKSNYPKMGAHFWLDVAPSQLPSSCPTYAVSYLTALHKYGAYFVDYAGISSVLGVLVESDMSYTYNGGSSVWSSFMRNLGHNSSGVSDLSIDSCGVNLQNHMHVLNPPSPG